MSNEDRIIKIVADHFDMPTKFVSLDWTLDELGFDDSDLITVVMAIEKEFEKKIDDRLVSEVKTVRDLLRMVEPEGVSS